MRRQFKLFSALACILAAGALAPDAQSLAQDEPEADETDQSAAEADEDNLAELLNSRQQLQQTFTLKRKINGEVVETKKTTVALTPGDPYRASEAGDSVLKRVKDAFDREMLTRVEALEEAKLDFTLADADGDGLMTSAEFLSLAKTWREGATRKADAPNDDIAHARQYRELLASIDPQAAEAQEDEAALAKFSFIAGAQGSIARKEYVREYLLDFDIMDANKDTLLDGDELKMFRAAMFGETLGM